VRNCRRGASLVESLVALWLTFGLLVLVAGLLSRYQQVAGTLALRVEGVDAARVGRDLIGLALDADPTARMEGSEARVRSFVGMAEECGEGAWRYQGRRQPEPLRDSLWVVTGGGETYVSALVSRESRSCNEDGDEGVGLVGDPPVDPEARLIRVFESGRYRVDDAVRYGRTGTGAQPLTAPVLDASASGVTATEDGIRLELLPRGRARSYRRGWRR
jgi:hypothetical protein